MLCIRGDEDRASFRNLVLDAVDCDLPFAFNDVVNFGLDMAVGAEMAISWWTVCDAGTQL